MTDDIEGYAKWQREFYDTHSRVPEPIDLWNSVRAQADSQAPVSEPIGYIYRVYGRLEFNKKKLDYFYVQHGEYVKGEPVYTAPSQAVVALPVDARREFEDWMVTSDGNCSRAYGHLDRYLDGDYKLSSVERDWLVWQAAQSPQAKAGDKHD